LQQPRNKPASVETPMRPQPTRMAPAQP
jgi:hypothetical protein